MKPAARRRTAWQSDHVVSADAFLITGVLFLLTMGLLALLFREASLWSEILSQAVLVASLVAGTLIAWTLHGNSLRGAGWLTMAVGIVAGAVVGSLAFFALFMLGRFVPVPSAWREGPWGSVLLLAVAVIAFLALPVYRAVHDLVRHSGSSAIAVVRLASLVVIVTVIGISVGFGGDVAEVGIFMVAVSAASAVAVVLAAWSGRWRARRRLARRARS